MPRSPLWVLTSLVVCLHLAGCYSPPVENGLVGQTETAIRAKLGAAHHEFAGHYGLPPLSFTQKFPGEVKTSVFAEPGGELYVSFEKRSGNWIAICNSWLPKGAAF